MAPRKKPGYTLPLPPATILPPPPPQRVKSFEYHVATKTKATTTTIDNALGAPALSRNPCAQVTGYLPGLAVVASIHYGLTMVGLFCGYGRKPYLIEFLKVHFISFHLVTVVLAFAFACTMGLDWKVWPRV